MADERRQFGRRTIDHEAPPWVGGVNGKLDGLERGFAAVAVRQAALENRQDGHESVCAEHHAENAKIQKENAAAVATMNGSLIVATTQLAAMEKGRTERNTEVDGKFNRMWLLLLSLAGLLISSSVLISVAAFKVILPAGATLHAVTPPAFHQILPSAQAGVPPP